MIKAPCGHPGELVIGTFARCLWRCDDPSTVAVCRECRARGTFGTSGRWCMACSGELVAASEADRRAEPGHVEMCACPRCQVRRRGREVVIRTKDGRDMARVPWDGVSSKIKWRAQVSGNIRHWILVDQQGDQVARGDASLDGVLAGDDLETAITLLGEPMRLLSHWGPSRIPMFLQTMRSVQSLTSFARGPGESDDALRERIHHHRQLSRRCTRADVEHAALSVWGVAEVVVEDDVRDHRTYVEFRRRAGVPSHGICGAVYDAVTRQLPVGIMASVEDVTTPRWRDTAPIQVPNCRCVLPTHGARIAQFSEDLQRKLCAALGLPMRYLQPTLATMCDVLAEQQVNAEDKIEEMRRQASLDTSNDLKLTL